VTTAALFRDVIGRLVRREDLAPELVEAAVSAILSGEASDAQIAGFAVGLRAKGETTAELAAIARTMMTFAERVVVSHKGPLVDTCGTGGDRAGTVNVSTMAALIVAGAGVRVAKHGNRAQSSQCGSADVLEALGVAIDLGPEGVGRCIDEAGIGFCLATRFHAALRFAAPVRRELGVPTSFNFVGPLANPAGVRRQALGVSDPAMAERVVGALRELGSEHALVFFGHDGLDELTTTTTSTVFELRNGEVRRFDVDPVALGLSRADRAALAGGTAAVNAAAVERVLAGEQGPLHDIAVLNAAAALVAGGAADDLASGVECARVSLTSGKAAAALESLVRVSVSADEAQG
jgi:anthranilate phosphoribosyltransferase